ncbi:HD domain-containing phosphohydrolase [Thermodesulforhabdus norvegica]|uniref:HDIG domain-containing protein n=1 Tax=Thermodesulforhabdus norvegica TaxID=39841 RepID=A0A1I4QJ49_9BACT|nr:HD domain-containing phosphohydrolase [Thermodesulforhabdus norvegica]SFM39786.1 HDIG domain-containing protein [Thermodesulforhabdus norvegica]
MVQGGRPVLIVDNSADCDAVAGLLGKEGIAVKRPSSGKELEVILAEESFPLILFDPHAFDYEDLELLQLLKEKAPDAFLVILTAPNLSRLGLEALKRGADDWVEKTDEGFQRLPFLVRRLLREWEIRNHLVKLEGLVDEFMKTGKAGFVLHNGHNVLETKGMEAIGDHGLDTSSLDSIQRMMFDAHPEVMEGDSLLKIQTPKDRKSLLYRSAKIPWGKGSAQLDLFFDLTPQQERFNEQKRLAGVYRKLLEQTIRVLSRALEFKDPYTVGHQKRVARLSVAIAEELGLERDRIEGLNTAALLHDIGKGLGVPLEILNKPGRLTQAEWELVKMHPRLGFELLKEIDFPWPVAEAVLQHHERLDGSGYPQGLKGEEIILEARIIAVADVVEAMTNHRPYRPALGLDRALAEIREGSGKRYDPQVVSACLSLLQGGFSLSADD